MIGKCLNCKVPDGKESVLCLWFCYFFIYLVVIKTGIVRKTLVIQIERFCINKINIKSPKNTLYMINTSSAFMLTERFTQWDISSLGQLQFSIHCEKKTNRTKIDFTGKDYKLYAYMEFASAGNKINFTKQVNGWKEWGSKL